MRFLPKALLGCVLSLALAAAGAAQEKLGDYLTKDGQLTQTLEVKDVQGGFAGFTGRLWVIEPSGAWRVGRVFNEKVDMEQKGTLTKEQLAVLAKELARYDLAQLAGKTEGKVTTNPHVVTIKFGKGESTLNLGAGEALPKPDPDKPTATAPGRFAGVVKAVQDAIPEKKKDKEKDPNK